MRKVLNQANENARRHNLAGKLVGGRLFVHELFGQAPWDRSWLYLVENLKTGEAELWRFCDLHRIIRTGQRQQRCKGDGYRANTGPECTESNARYDDDWRGQSNA